MPAQILDSDVNDAVARTRAAEDQDVANDLEKQIGESSKPEAIFSGRNLPGWAQRLPRNISMGLFRATLNTVETADDLFKAGAEFVVEEVSRPPVGIKEHEDLSEDIEPVAPLRTLFPGAFEAAHNFADEVEAQNTTSDGIVQGITQFVIPFSGYLKAVGGIKNISTLARLGKLAFAEGVTSASAFEAHEGRVADLVEMGRQMENGFGTLLNKMSSEGSLANSYIEWMTNREDEGEFEGRYKNAVDSLVSTAGIVGVLKTAGTSLKIARQSVANFGTKGPMRLQEGMIAFHGSPFSFDKFSREAIGTGEGAQAFGHGLYFAENKGVAEGYQRALQPGKGSGSKDVAARIIDDAVAGGKPLSEAKDSAIRELEKRRARALKQGDEDSPAFIRSMDDAIESIEDGTFRGQLLEVEIPDEVTAKMLDWDAPLNKQPDVLQRMVDDGLLKPAQAPFEDRFILPNGTMIDPADAGKDIVISLGQGQAASEALEKAGIPGIKFFDAKSRNQIIGQGFIKPLTDAIKGADKRTRNIVLFDPDNIKQVKRDNQVVFSQGQ